MATKAKAQLGTTNLKRVIAFLIITGVMVKELIGNFTLTRAVSLGFHIAENQDLLEAGPLALQEFRDLDVAESQEISDFIGAELDLENDSLEFRIEEGLDLLPEGYALIKSNLAFYAKASNYVRSWGNPDEGKFEEMQAKLRALPTAA